MLLQNEETGVEYSNSPLEGFRGFGYRRTYLPWRNTKERTIWCKTREDFLALIANWNSDPKWTFEPTVEIFGM